mgnify:CR=1 FL=1
MLILGRRKNEQVLIRVSEPCEIIVKYMGKGRNEGEIVLGFDAPQSASIVRDDAINTTPKKRNSDES